MSRKHFCAVAAVIAEERQRNSDSPRTVATIDRMARELGATFKAANGRFCMARFLTACGIE